MDIIIMFILVNVVQMLVFYMYTRELLGFKRSMVWFAVCFFIGAAIDELAVSYSAENNVIRNAIIYIVCIGITTFITCKGSWKKKIFVILAFAVFSMSVEILLASGATLLMGEQVNEVLSNDAISNLVLIAAQMLMSVILLFVICVWKKNRDYSIPTIQWIGVTLVSLGCFLSIGILGAGAIKDNKISKADMAIDIILIFINFISYYYYIILAQKNKMEFQTRLQINQTSMYREWYEEIKNVNEQMQSFRHDMANHFQVMRGICENDDNNPYDKLAKIEKYLNSLGTEYKMISSGVNTGNAALDAVIGMKKSYAMSKNINMETDIHVPKDMNYDAMDMVVVLGNLLDNAIEACEKLEDSKNISIMIKYNLKNIIITVKNTCNGELEAREDEQHELPMTTKGDFINHGIGMKNVKNIVDKYEGEISWCVKNNIFKVVILMYQQGKND